MNLRATNLVKALIGFLIVIPLGAAAHNKIVVVPLLDDIERLENVITVSKKNGDFTDISSALDSIQDASSDNPYLIVVGPGLYTVTQTIVMKDYVSISGSGQATTILSGFVSSSSVISAAIIRTANHARLNNMTIRNNGGDANNVIGVYNETYESSIVSEVNIVVYGGNSNNLGWYSDTGSGALTNSTISVFAGGPSSKNAGIDSFQSFTVYKNLTIIVNLSGEPSLRNIGAASGVIGSFYDDVSIRVNGTEAYGVRFFGIGLPDPIMIRNSSIVAETAALFALSGNQINISHSSLASGNGNNITDGDGTFVCLNSDNLYTNKLDVAELGADCEL